MKRSALYLLAWLLWSSPSLALDPVLEEPRVVLALYDSQVEENIRQSLIHRRFELPMNHLGLVLRYHDIGDGMPAIDELADVRGAISWFHDSVNASPREYLEWAVSLLESGRQLVVVGELGVSADDPGVSREDVNRVWSRLGLRSDGNWIRMTYDLKVIESDPAVVGFERKLVGILPGYPVVNAVGRSTRRHLTVARHGSEGTESTLISTNEAGGFIASGYAVWSPDERTQQWIVNPFAFLRLAFATDSFPKPDTTTVSGRRIFYSHIDGDGWRNRSLIPSYRKRRALSAEVVYRELIQPFPGLPVSVAPVVGDLDPAWHGSEATLQVARDTFALPHVEAGTHTYSHPLDWGHFAPGEASKAPNGSDGQKENEGWLSPVSGWFATALFGEDDSVTWNPTDGSYDKPRSYLVGDFDLDQEIEGSVAFIESLLPGGKQVELLQWSGNTRPFPEAIAATRKLGLRNINGGDSRFDFEYPSYTWVAPLGVRVGGELQIYASNSNENTYTDLWTDRYFGFKHLVATIENTEHPLRVRPFNIYYHMYSGERLASLNAVLDNLGLAKDSRLAPIATSRYAAIADGFYSTRLERLGPLEWRVLDRDGVETLRFDNADDRVVDWERSHGVIGQIDFQGSLFVALDGSVTVPIVALREKETGKDPGAPAHLVEGRYLVSELSRRSAGFSFTARGFGAGEMVWSVPEAGDYEISVEQNRKRFSSRVRADDNRHLRVKLDFAPVQPVRIAVQRKGPAR